MIRIHRIHRVSIALALFLGATLGSAAARADEAASSATKDLEAPFEDVTGQRGGLTSSEVARRTVSTSPELARRRADLENASLAVDRATAELFPRLTLTGKYSRLNPVESDPIVPGTAPTESIDNQFSYQAGLTIPISDYVMRLPQSLDAAEKSRDASELDADAAEQKTSLEARLLYYDWVKSELGAVVAGESLKLAEQQQKRVASLVSAGSATLADQASADALVARSRREVEHQRHLASLGRSELAIAMHASKSEASGFAIGEDLAGIMRGDPPKARTARGPAAMRPELAAIEARVDSLETQSGVARSRAFPHVEVFGNIGAVNPDQRRFPSEDAFHMAWSVGVGVSWSPNDTVDGVLSSRQVDAQAASAQAQATSLRDSIRREVAEAESALSDAETSIDTSVIEVAASEEAYRARRELFDAGRATNIEVTEAHNDLLRARMDAVGAAVGLRVAEAKLAYARGTGAP